MMRVIVLFCCALLTAQANELVTDSLADFSSALTSKVFNPNTVNDNQISSCWQSVLSNHLYGRLNKRDDAASPFPSHDNQSMCTGMSEADTRDLSYMLAVCHLAESGRPLKQSSPECESVIVRNEEENGGGYVAVYSESEGDSDETSHCTDPAKLTDIEFQIYTQFKVHVYSICDKLTANHWRVETSRQIDALTNIAGIVQDSIEVTNKQIQEKADALGNGLSEISAAQAYHHNVVLTRHEELRLAQALALAQNEELRSAQANAIAQGDAISTSIELAISQGYAIKKSQESIQNAVESTSEAIQLAEARLTAQVSESTAALLLKNEVIIESQELAIEHSRIIQASQEALHTKTGDIMEQTKLIHDSTKLIHATIDETTAAIIQKNDAILAKEDAILAKENAILAAQEEYHVTTMKQTGAILKKNDNIMAAQEDTISKAQAILVSQEAMSSAVDQTNISLEGLKANILVLESFANKLWDGFQTLATFSHFLAMLNISFVLTATPASSMARAPLFLLSVVDGAIEYGLYYLKENGYLMDETFVSRSELVLSVRSWCILLSAFSLIWSVHCWCFGSNKRRIVDEQDGDEALLTFGPAGRNTAVLKKSDLLRPSPIFTEAIANAVDEKIRSRQVSPMEGTAEMRSDSASSVNSVTELRKSIEDLSVLINSKNGTKPGGRPPLHKSNSNSFRREEFILEEDGEEESSDGTSQERLELTEENVVPIFGPSTTKLSKNKRSSECLNGEIEESPRKLLKQISWSPDDKDKDKVEAKDKVSTKKVTGTKRKAASASAKKVSKKDDEEEEEEKPAAKNARKRGRR